MRSSKTGFETTNGIIASAGYHVTAPRESEAGDRTALSVPVVSFPVQHNCASPVLDLVLIDDSSFHSVSEAKGCPSTKFESVPSF
ncbi:hypothetical protein PISMIDRAFT_536514 [Pisolithus microcarpus 441]|uniref:Uncharacterized protein n=1 Tax=Pisolithus microcarpus 441 TaxID=765257 RepID=A0A0C9YL70_9AGAM|nr:hypothetical protein PISMIDRAFT_536514 [Pisolithus microcarpus 441]